MRPLALLPLILAAASIGEISVDDNVYDDTPESDPDAGGEQPIPDAADGSVGEPPDAEVPPTEGGTTFLLPWTGGVSSRVTQGHDGFSHVNGGKYAWDFGLPQGTVLRASHDGVVRAVRGDSTRHGCDSSYINDASYVVIDRGDGLETLYLHLISTSVTVGQEVTRGTIIGRSGQTGWTCGAHLHFQVQKSPDGGGTTGWFNTNVSEGFHDTGSYYDPPYLSQPVSANAR